MKTVIIIAAAVCFACTALAGGDRAESNKTDEGDSAHADNHVLPPLQTEKYEYYEVCGCSEKDLHCDLMDKAIKCNDGKKYDSVTNWKIKWDYDYNRGPESCSTAGFRATVDIIFRLPKWVSRGDAPAQLVDKWNSYLKNLLLHEMGHRDRAAEAASELTRVIADLPPARTCSELDRKVNSAARTRLNKLIVDQEEYDLATSHGLTQGVSFP